MAERQIDKAREAGAPADPTPQESTNESPPVSATTAPTPPSPSAPQPWPHEGSYVRYAMEAGKSFTGSDIGWRAFANASWRYHDGDWTGACDGVVYEGGNATPVHRTYTAAHPPHWPLFDTRSPPAVGEPVQVWILGTCAIGNDTHVFVGGNATTFRAQDESPPFAFSTTWSRSSGLVLSWSETRSGLAPTHDVGWLTATDAP
ncbi:MAG: hypothetical protein QOE90_3627 [Thermoplasmata archaeon]|nr:hypothetical protein [Thermoplasmata archaeon]